MRGIEKLKAGDFNIMGQTSLDDGSVIVTLTKRGERRVYVFQVDDLYGPDEEVLVEAVSEV